MTSQVVIETLHSDVLRGNPLGDPHVRQVPIYLPPGYADSRERYATAYMLAGYTGKGQMMLNASAWDENLPERLDRLIASGAMRPMIVVMPDCMTRYGGSQYINSAATGRYEDHLTQELIPFIDARYRTLADREHRAVLGKSSGGYGAMLTGMRHSDLFAYVADHSGDKYFELCYKPDFPKCLNGLAKYGGARKFLAGFPHPRPRPRHWMDVIAILAMAACYSPNPDSPLSFDLPFDEYTGELNEQVWARWLEHDPVYLLTAHAEALRSLRLLYLDCGSSDEYNLHYGARLFVERLKPLGIEHIYEEFDDGHMNIQYRYDVSFARISAAMPA